MDMPPGSEGVFSALGGAAMSAITTVLTMARRFGKRIESLEHRTASISAFVKELAGKVSGLERERSGIVSASPEALRRLIDDRIRAQARREERASQREIVTDQRAFVRAIVQEVVEHDLDQACTTFRRDVDRLERDVLAARAIADAATPGATFAEHLGSESDRWDLIHRTLGRIEGAMLTAREKMRQQETPL